MSYLDYLQENIEKEWSELIKSSYKLIIATTLTRNISKKWNFYFRNQIINELTPPEVKILTLEFDFNFLSKLERQSLSGNIGGITVHGKMIEELQKIIPDNSLCLLIDIDAYPLNMEAIKISFLSAKKFGVFGNLQRTDGLNNGEHLFIGPSFMCFENSKIKALGDNVWHTSEDSDVGEKIAWEYPDIMDQELFRPIKTIFKPIWRLDQGNKPVLGIGTTFGVKNKAMTYHHFYSRIEISKLHFFFISFLSYSKLRLIKLQKIKPLVLWRKLYFFIRHETKYGFKYIKNQL